MLRQCQSRLCHREFPGRHRFCCTDCHMQLGGHSRRCQKVQRRLGRERGTYPVGAAHICGTAGCGRTTGPGYDACCSRWRMTAGHTHSRRCQQNIQRGHGASWNATWNAAASSSCFETSSVTAIVVIDDDSADDAAPPSLAAAIGTSAAFRRRTAWHAI